MIAVVRTFVKNVGDRSYDLCKDIIILSEMYHAVRLGMEKQDPNINVN